MTTLYRINQSHSPIRISQLDENLEKLGFHLDASGAFYYKNYQTPNGHLNIGVICDDENIYDIKAFASVKNGIKTSSALRKFEEIYELNFKALNSLSMVKVAYGPEGGSGGLHNVNFDESLGGPRWWLYGDDEEDLSGLEEWIQKQTRYNPQYLAVGRPLQIGEDVYTVLATLDGNVQAARLEPERQEVFLRYVDKNNKINKIHLPSFKDSQEMGKNDGDFAQDLNKYQIKIVQADGQSMILIRKKDTRGDIRGIWEINGKDPSPGFGYVDEDWRTSYSMHPELLDDAQWTSGAWSPGRNNYDQGSRMI